MMVEEGRKVMVMMWSWCQGGAGLVDKGAGSWYLLGEKREEEGKENRRWKGDLADSARKGGT